jgi:2-polyprenyl-3-methyl-5-hydroxy-6-metoxy-1,4-benzoquinol methylase
MLVRIDQRARRAGLALELFGCDIKPLAVDYARAQTSAAGTRAEFFVLDAARDSIPGDFDVIVSSLFLHHLDEPEATAFLRRAGASTRGLLLIHDLVRNRAGHLLATLGIPLLLCNDVCRADGPSSVESAFTVPEARALADHAGLTGAQIEPRFPFRFLLRWERS